MLSQEYDHTDDQFSADSLLGHDRVLYSQLQKACRLEDFYLCLATLKITIKEHDKYDSDIAGGDSYHRECYRQEYYGVSDETALGLSNITDNESRSLFYGLKTDFCKNSLLQPTYFDSAIADSDTIVEGNDWINSTVSTFRRKVCG